MVPWRAAARYPMGPCYPRSAAYFHYGPRWLPGCHWCNAATGCSSTASYFFKTSSLGPISVKIDTSPWKLGSRNEKSTERPSVVLQRKVFGRHAGWARRSTEIADLSRREPQKQSEPIWVKKLTDRQSVVLQRTYSGRGADQWFFLACRMHRDASGLEPPEL